MKIENQLKRKSIRNNVFIEKTVREAKARARKQNPKLFEVSR